MCGAWLTVSTRSTATVSALITVVLCVHFHDLASYVAASLGSRACILLPAGVYKSSEPSLPRHKVLSF